MPDLKTFPITWQYRLDQSSTRWVVAGSNIKAKKLFELWLTNEYKDYGRTERNGKLSKDSIKKIMKGIIVHEPQIVKEGVLDYETCKCKDCMLGIEE